MSDNNGNINGLGRPVPSPNSSEGGKKMGARDPLILDHTYTGEDALRDYLNGSDYTPDEFDNLPAYLRRMGKER